MWHCRHAGEAPPVAAQAGPRSTAQATAADWRAQATLDTRQGGDNKQGDTSTRQVCIDARSIGLTAPHRPQWLSHRPAHCPSAHLSSPQQHHAGSVNRPSTSSAAHAALQRTTHGFSLPLPAAMAWWLQTPHPQPRRGPASCLTHTMHWRPCASHASPHCTWVGAVMCEFGQGVALQARR